MNKNINKRIIFIALIMLLLLVTIGTTLAYMFMSSGSVENTFKPSKVSCAVVEANGNPVFGSIENTGTTKTNVQIKNTGDTDAYIRVALVVNWSSENGSKVWAQKPVIDKDYIMTLDLANGWFDGEDGFYYYKKAISPNELTSILIDEARLMDGATIPKGTDGTPYFLSIEIVASAIQSAPTSTVTKQWKVTVGTDGTLTVGTPTQTN